MFGFSQQTIANRDLHPGHTVIFDDGTRDRVVSASFGKDLIGGGDKKTAHAVVVTFKNGLIVRVHPSDPVKVRV